uniref:HSF-type DNA-binding domain-containing protein n=1 Tax=Heterosigma akashiwo TaxID=2829 RepID=A0A6V2VRS5_HETAK|mmetsp:Transcript_36680/g.63981  ORF Transcript_36680/g.63981 Transcript_36680/m.63981 type:complete len:397 (-) Transcript_36680:310-1500(-)|eukprot:CAMPEP_0194569880 /NCGR_PEP_ID=MMETSP0292-20121207/7417_1 /TAXON_ID=39354 /ORGANISM="Heterosigma akashiwo, Strain CCMP2393" /LENGTH=396 /DNA_ID=CAMNT_0039420215 /DNA_START=228 /DNA_END=1418 /DNA_ORIENTATION=+
MDKCIVNGDFPRTGSRGAPQVFARKLYQILLTESKDVICWNEPGTAFFIKDMDRFSQEVLMKYFRHNNYSSFQRQMNLYGFKKISRGPFAGANMHQQFLRGRPDLLVMVKRKPRSSSPFPSSRSVSPVPPSSRKAASRKSSKSPKSASPTPWNQKLSVGGQEQQPGFSLHRVHKPEDGKGFPQLLPQPLPSTMAANNARMSAQSLMMALLSNNNTALQQSLLVDREIQSLMTKPPDAPSLELNLKLTPEDAMAMCNPVAPHSLRTFPPAPNSATGAHLSGFLDAAAQDAAALPLPLAGSIAEFSRTDGTGANGARESIPDIKPAMNSSMKVQLTQDLPTVKDEGLAIEIPDENFGLTLDCLSLDTGLIEGEDLGPNTADWKDLDLWFVEGADAPVC